VTHPSASDSFSTLALYKFTYLLTYLLDIRRRFLPGIFKPDCGCWNRRICRLLVAISS